MNGEAVTRQDARQCINLQEANVTNYVIYELHICDMMHLPRLQVLFHKLMNTTNSVHFIEHARYDS